MNLVQYYVPTDDKSDEVKDIQPQLQGILKKLRDQYINILMCAINANIGSDNTGYNEVMGSHGLREVNAIYKWRTDRAECPYIINYS